MKLLVLGYARSGKDTVAEMLEKIYSLNFCSSSEFANHRIVFPILTKKYNYQTLSECFNDRFNHRQEWFEIISAYNRPHDRLAKEIILENDIYVGMRNKNELKASRNLFDHILWIEAEARGIKKEDINSCNITPDDCTYVLKNNSDIHHLKTQVILFGETIGLKKKKTQINLINVKH